MIEHYRKRPYQNEAGHVPDKDIAYPMAKAEDTEREKGNNGFLQESAALEAGDQQYMMQGGLEVASEDVPKKLRSAFENYLWKQHEIGTGLQNDPTAHVEMKFLKLDESASNKLNDTDSYRLEYRYTDTQGFRKWIDLEADVHRTDGALDINIIETKNEVRGKK